jgi:hypothetical protein
MSVLFDSEILGYDMTNSVEQLPMLDARDREEIARVTDPQLRDTILASLQHYRRQPQVRVGDALPTLSVTRLTDGRVVSLPQLSGAQPLALIFGSIT